MKETPNNTVKRNKMRKEGKWVTNVVHHKYSARQTDHSNEACFKLHPMYSHLRSQTKRTSATRSIFLLRSRVIPLLRKRSRSSQRCGRSSNSCVSRHSTHVHTRPSVLSAGSTASQKPRRDGQPPRTNEPLAPVPRHRAKTLIAYTMDAPAVDVVCEDPAKSVSFAPYGPPLGTPSIVRNGNQQTSSGPTTVRDSWATLSRPRCSSGPQSRSPGRATTPYFRRAAKRSRFETLTPARRCTGFLSRLVRPETNLGNGNKPTLRNEKWSASANRPRTVQPLGGASSIQDGLGG